MNIQGFGEEFHLEKLQYARLVAKEITLDLSKLIRPGMSEDGAHALYKELCSKRGIEKQWHPPKIRFGPNTTKSFKEISEDYKLKAEDIFFIDIGPVIDHHEADYGEAFYLGSDHRHKNLCLSSVKVFDDVKDFWKENNCSGIMLYEFAKLKAREFGYELNLNSDGHRIGDFPHHVFFRGGVPECEEILIPNAWILEIHLFDSISQRGAFFEDLLV